MSNNKTPKELAEAVSTSKIPFSDAILFWLKLGFISFGGPAGQIAMMHQELVEKRRWISEGRFLHALNYCMLLPGPEAQQLATYIGWLMHKGWGGIIAGALFVLPSLLILIALSWVYIAYGDVPLVVGVFYGVKPAVTAIILFAAYRIGSRAISNRVLFGIAIGAFLAIFWFKLPFPLIVLFAGLIGFFGGRLWPHQFSTKAAHGKAVESKSPAIIDNHSVLPKHAQFSASKLVLAFTIGFLLWLIPIGLLYFIYGWEHTLTQMAWFFTKAALVTFGGAYAVLPYIYQGAATHYGWATPQQMMDGLALGETTPGPLIMVVAFVGFIGGYVNQLFGPDQLFLAGAVAASLVTWFTFVPSFVFIFAGGPFIETTHGNLKFTAPLTAITAAVVGVILNLAVFFAYHMLWPQGFDEAIDLPSLVISIVAMLGLFYFKLNIMMVIMISAAIGLLAQLIA
ncbi:MAG: chromate efflux transporter [Gammaproteobacteria bacterium]|nr:chromate efflux transporter [Gammaproteobacteria bacterium]